jgi:hypothetical protein
LGDKVENCYFDLAITTSDIRRGDDSIEKLLQFCGDNQMASPITEDKVRGNWRLTLPIFYQYILCYHRHYLLSIQDEGVLQTLLAQSDIRHSASRSLTHLCALFLHPKTINFGHHGLRQEYARSGDKEVMNVMFGSDAYRDVSDWIN